MNGGKEKYQYYIKEKKNAAVVRHVYAICPKEAISMVEDEEGF